MRNLKKGEIIALILAILTIISLTQGIFGIPPIKEWKIWQQDKNSQIELIMDPISINEGQYDKINIEITIPKIKEKNITFLSLNKNNIIIDRIGKNEQTSVSSNIRWNNNYNNEYVLNYYSNPYSSYNGNVIKASGELSGCNNCFMGEKFPYKFTYTFQYKIGDGPIETAIIEKIIPII